VGWALTAEEIVRLNTASDVPLPSSYNFIARYTRKPDGAWSGDWGNENPRGSPGKCREAAPPERSVILFKKFELRSAIATIC